MLCARAGRALVDGSRVLVPVHRPRLQADLERPGADGDSGDPFEAGRRFPLRHRYVEGVEEGREEEEQFHPSQDLAQTHPPADAEGQEVFGLGNFALGVDEPGRIELLGLVPQGGVHVDGVQQRHHLGVLR